MHKNSRAKKDILYIAISSFILTAIWVGFNIYHAAATSTISEELQKQIQPIEPRFDTQVIKELQNRKKIEPDYTLDQTTIQNSTPPLLDELDTDTIGTPSAN